VIKDWPALNEFFRIWLERYPEVSEGTIFDLLREATEERGSGSLA